MALRTVLLISHRFSSVRSADRIYVLERGRIVEDGSHEQLMSRDGLYAELFTLQACVLVTPRIRERRRTRRSPRIRRASFRAMVSHARASLSW
jgi:ABC-type glutathione transport system ATPase component